MQGCKLKVLELFGGIGSCTKALKRLGIDIEVVDYVEIDKYAVKSYNAINGTNFEPQDVSEWDKDIEANLIMHGSPCQDFSLAGKQAGGDKGSGTRSSLMYETIRIVEKLRPKYVIWENVRNILSKTHKHNFYAYLRKLEELGYKNFYQILNSKDYEIPQNRERVFTISILGDDDFCFPKKKELKLRLKDMLEEEVDEKYYLSEKMINYISAVGTENFKNPDCKINLDIARPLTTDPNKRAGTSNYICNELPDNFDLRECFLIKEATKKGYAEAYEGDGVYINRPHQKRGVVQRGMIQTLKTSCDVGVVVKSKNGLQIPLYKNTKQLRETIEQNDLYEGKPANLDLYNRAVYEHSQTLTDAIHNSQRLWDGLRIRKLTPLEYWRLMGFDDDDFKKAVECNSNTQLYKQAGNSIVVNVLEAILKNLLINRKPSLRQMDIFDFI